MRTQLRCQTLQALATVARTQIHQQVLHIMAQFWVKFTNADNDARAASMIADPASMKRAQNKNAAIGCMTALSKPRKFDYPSSTAPNFRKR
ncbi:hypothetical protein PQR10_26605 [Paraburkholderia phytofirmans]|uniref:Uncharacterized protein n=1 Tax=Paraburkholderia phytofirmans (strain DSM 17436 / LMG 22146 / PsJN) TaxID=398527 RepID=B2T701_PARPJ|nr:hypothetical protein Bphyt_3594 [Paraburkholderia phytofirmans PsJN]